MARETMIKRWVQVVPGAKFSMGHESQGLVRGALKIVGPAAFGAG